tara:strand:- start:20057 stop:21097 length:1041 start_codon:yes stop_codon:yes gene_type:complete
MRYLFLFISLLTTGSLFSQITITSTDLPQPGVSYYRSTQNNPTIDVTETGAYQQWIYTGLQADSRDTLVYNTVSQTPFLYQFLFNNPLDQIYKATEAKYSPDVNLGGVLKMTNNYLFSKNSASEWTEVGLGTTVSKLPIPTKYTDTKIKLKLPLAFLNTNTDTYSYLLTIPAFGTQGQDGTLSYMVDGWGTIETPAGIFNALRVKTNIVKSDTIYIQQLNFGIRIPSTETVYEWYAPGEGFPVLTLTEQQGRLTSAIFKDNSLVGITENEMSSTNRIYPNPVINSVHLALNATDYQVTIIDLSGKTVLVSPTLSPAQLNVSKLPKGMYFIKLENQTKHETLRFMKQ